MSVVAAPPASPFKGLAAFEDSDFDALFFFGREREREVLVANLQAARLTVLYGESGVGKSSLLRAAVVRALREAEPDGVVVLADRWSDDVGDALEELRRAEQGYLILDQFEEYFLYHADADGPGTMLHDLPELLHENPRVNVLISLREDALAQLDAFKARLPAVFANQLRLEHLDRESGRAAILGPVGRWNDLTGEWMFVEPELVEGVLNEVATGRLDLARAAAEAAEERTPTASAGAIEAPYLQLVLERIWDEERGARSSELRLSTLRALGGAELIVREHLERALDALGPDQKDVAANVFDHLVTPSGTKIAHRLGDLAQYASVPEDALLPVLATLNRERILRTVGGPGGPRDRYEIFHDVLAEPVIAWRLRRRLEHERRRAERRHRRTVRFAIATGVALVLVAGVAVFALVQWSRAKSQTRRAQAEGLEESALAQLSVDPERGLLQALDATRLEPNARSEDVLRNVLLASRVRLVLAARGPVRAVAYSPDGRRILAASTDGRARLYDAASGRLLHVMWHSGRVVAAAFSPDGTLVVTADDKGVARVWETATGRQLAVMHHRQAISSASFSRDGALVVTAGADALVNVWEARTGRLVRRFRLPGPVTLARLSPDGRTLVAVAQDGAEHIRARVFDVRSGRLLDWLPELAVNDVQFSPDGRLLATGSKDGVVRLRHLRTRAPVRVLDDGGKNVLALAFSPRGRLLATAGGDGGVRVWRLPDDSRLFFFTGHSDHVVALSWSPDGRFLADASPDRTARIWQVSGIEAGSPAAVLRGDSDAIRSVAFSPGGKSVVTGSDDGTARVWDVRVDQMLEPLGRPGGVVLTAAFDPSGRRVVASSAGAAARIWDVRSHRLLQTLGAGTTTSDASFSPDGQLVVTADGDGVVRLWDTSRGRVVRSLHLGSPVVAAAFSPHGDLVAAGGRSGSAAVWRSADGRPIARVRRAGAIVDIRFSRDGSRLLVASRSGATVLSLPDGATVGDVRVPGGIVRAALSPDGKAVAVAGAHNRARIYDAESGALLLTLLGHSSPLTDVIFSADGRRLATTSVDGHPRIWDVRTGRLIYVLVGHFGPVSTAAFSGDGRWLVTAGPISAGLWPLHTGQLLFYLRGDTKALTSVSFSPDQRRIITASKDGTVRIYDCVLCVPLDGLVRLAEQRLQRTARALTPSQRAQYLRH